jgi:hypothetical protein
MIQKKIVEDWVTHKPNKNMKLFELLKL